MARTTPDKFQFSIKVLETVTHDKRLDVRKGAMALLDTNVIAPAMQEEMIFFK